MRDGWGRQRYFWDDLLAWKRRIASCLTVPLLQVWCQKWDYRTFIALTEKDVGTVLTRCFQLEPFLRLCCAIMGLKMLARLMKWTQFYAHNKLTNITSDSAAFYLAVFCFWTNSKLESTSSQFSSPALSSRQASDIDSSCSNLSAQDDFFLWNSKRSPRRPRSSSAADTFFSNDICRQRLRWFKILWHIQFQFIYLST